MKEFGQAVPDRLLLTIDYLSLNKLLEIARFFHFHQGRKILI
jgi:hypothetical protein